MATMTIPAKQDEPIKSATRDRMVAHIESVHTITAEGPLWRGLDFLCREVDRLNALVDALTNNRSDELDGEDFLIGMPALELRQAWPHWQELDRSSNAVSDLTFTGELYHFAWWNSDMPDRRIDSCMAWGNAYMRPHGKTWAEVRRLAAELATLRKNCGGVSPETCALAKDH